MPSQSVEIAETIAAVKRALIREREVPSDQPITTASNRGNKLKKGARYVHEGSLAYMHGSAVYRQKIEHAGYTRYILERNPRRYNEYGDELEDSESDEEADADAADENPYSAIRLEELLCPLKHPSALSTHPTLSDGFHSKALPDMVQDTALRLRQEKANLWRSKNLNRELLGDEAWFPCAAVESAEDWNIFTPRKQIFEGKESKKRKRNNNVPVGGIAARSSASPNDKVFETNSATPLNNKESRGKSPTYINGHSTSEVVAMTNAEDVNKSSLQRTDLSGREMESAHASDVDGTADLSLREAAPEPELDPILAANDTNSQGREREEVNEHSASEQTGCKAQDAAETVDMHEESKADQNCELRSEHSETSPPPPSRRITRALAATNILNSHLIAPTPPLSPAPTSSSSSSASMLQIDPLFLLPPSVHPPDSTSIYYGLPPEEALETRRLLTSYIQKQEESVRGYESVLSKLLKAQRLRSEVLEMCKAEGHVGEMSDGEDWIDYEQWDLQPGELLKGRDEDEDAVEENTIGGRKGKRRARN